MEIRKFLRTTLYEDNMIRVDYWTFIHMAAGFLLYYLFGLGWMLVLFILVAYEALEPLLVPWFFRSENKQDTLFDIVIGMIGYFIATLI